MFGEISQMEKDILYDITYMRNLKKCNKLVNIKKKKKKKGRLIENELAVTSRETEGRRARQG